MKNVFLLGNGFDLHHNLPTKYYDFMCVAEYLLNERISYPLSAGIVFSKCISNKHILSCYNSHQEVFDNLQIENDAVNKITECLRNNLWFNYFSFTLDRDLGWIDFEKEINNVITTLDAIIPFDEDTVFLPQDSLLQAFILRYFSYFIDVEDDTIIYPMDDYDILNSYLVEYPHNSGINIVDRKKIFNELYEKLLDFQQALSTYFECFIENSFDLLHKDTFTNKNRIEIINMADNAVSFNYTSTLERLYFNKKAFHIHGTIKEEKMVLGVNPDESDDIGTNDTSLIKFKKYYQRERSGTDMEYIDWYREIISNNTDYRLIIIGHSLDETDKDIISDMFLNAKEIYITYYDEACKDSYIANIVKMFGKSGFDKFRREQQMKFVLLSEINTLKDKIEPEKIKWTCCDFDKGPIDII